MRGFVIFVIFAGFLGFLGADNVVILEDSHESYSPTLAEGARGWVDSSLQDSRFDSSLRGDSAESPKQSKSRESKR